MHARWSTAAGFACLATAVLVGFGAAGGTAAAAEAQDVLGLVALTGPQGGDVTVTVPAASGGADLNELEHVHVRLSDANDADGVPNRIVNVGEVDAKLGVANVRLGRVARGTRVDVQVQFRAQNPPRTVILRGRAVAKLRPDLVVAMVHAPPQTLTTRPIDVVADVEELNGETGAEATLTLMLGPTPVADAEIVTVRAGGSASVTFEDVELEQATTAELTLRVEDADPFETNTTNNARSRTVDVTEHELVRSNVLVQSLGGYGAQFNQHVYAPISNVPSASVPDLEQKAKELGPQLVRIFYNDNWEERMATAPQNMASFIRTVELAQAAGATINVTYHTASVARLQPLQSMTRFADVLQDLVVTRGLTNVRWVTIQNEPNTPGIALTLEQYEALYDTLHALLVARGLRDHIKLMGGDLIESSGARHQTIWFEYIAEHMSDVVDAYSVHIYWNYWDIPRMEFRLRDVRRIVNAFEGAARKPTYVMEFAARGANSFPGKPTVSAAYWEDGTELRKSNVGAFQHLWFNVVSAQLGYTGTSKWDAFWGRYDNSSAGNQSYWMFGTAEEGWPIYPSYYSLQLLLQTTQPGSEVVRVAPWGDDDWQVGLDDEPEKELVAYAAADGALTLIGLDTHARQLNTVSAESPTYSIGGLAANARFTLALWNAAGNGENSVAGTVTTNAAGVARFEVPLHAAFALTTLPVS
jgi:hypothetical protein